MRRSFPVEFVFQLFALAFIVIVVHAAYVTVIRPKAELFLEQEAAAMAADENHVARRSAYVVLRDYEQEVCLILMFWALSILAYKAVTAYREQRLLDLDLVPVLEGTRILPEDTHEISRRVQALPAGAQRLLLPRALLTALHRFNRTRNIQDVSTATRGICQAEADRLESELSMIRYITWAIPSVGFIGTVRGIGDALGQAHRAVEGDITGVTASLGVAFNSTFIALVISIVLMFFIHQLQLLQERLVLDSEGYVDRWLVRRLKG